MARNGVFTPDTADTARSGQCDTPHIGIARSHPPNIEYILPVVTDHVTRTQQPGDVVLIMRIDSRPYVSEKKLNPRRERTGEMR